MLLGRSRAQLLWNASLLFLTTASHGFLDAMTNGGLGIAFFSPFDPTRYFFPWKPILVSPIGLGRFLSQRGAAVLAAKSFTSGCRPLLSASRFMDCENDRGRTGKRGAQLKTIKRFFRAEGRAAVYSRELKMR